MAASRVAKNDHSRIGWMAKTERQTGKWHNITILSTYEANSIVGKMDVIGITVDSPELTSVVYLTPGGAVELMKGLMMQLMTCRGGPITATADDEFRSIVAQLNTMIARQDAESEAVVKAVTERFDKKE